MKKCINCDKELVGRQQKYCSRKCKNVVINHAHKTYENQKERGIRRKKELVVNAGGKCEDCGYTKNLAGLCFHHIDKSTKTMALTNRECANNSMELLLEEAKKCRLLCQNCHMEEHYPEYDYDVIGW